jgi:hypothetical protein
MPISRKYTGDASRIAIRNMSTNCAFFSLTEGSDDRLFLRASPRCLLPLRAWQNCDPLRARCAGVVERPSVWKGRWGYLKLSDSIRALVEPIQLDDAPRFRRQSRAPKARPLRARGD